VPQGAATTIWGCLSPTIIDEDRGAYLSDCGPITPSCRAGEFFLISTVMLLLFYVCLITWKLTYILIHFIRPGIDEKGVVRAKLWEVMEKQVGEAAAKL
jgi:SNF family Na+-dependent transporter